MRNKSFILHSVFLAMMVSIITLQPYFMHGTINFYETGIYLPQINEVFHGKALYRDIFVLRGPLEILMPMSMMAFLGKHIGVLNAYFYFGTVLTLIIYAIFALKIFSARGFVYLFTLVLTARTFPWSCFNVWGGIRFGLGILALLLAVNFLQYRKVDPPLFSSKTKQGGRRKSLESYHEAIFLNKKNAVWLFFAGVVSSLAFWTSFELGAFSLIAILSMLCLCGYSEARGVKAILRYGTVYASGAVIASAPFVIYLVLNRAFIPYIDTVRIILTKMTKVFDMSLYFETPRNLKEFLLAFSPLNHNFKYTLPFFFYLAVGIYMFKNFMKRKLNLNDIIIIPLAVYGMFLYKGAFRDIEGPQYRMALQPLLLIMFFYIERAYQFIRRKEKDFSGAKRALIVFLLIAVPLYSIGFSIAKYNKRFFIFKEAKSLVFDRAHAAIPHADPDPIPIKSEAAKGVIVPGLQAKEVDSVISYISSHTKDREIVFTFSDMGTYNFFTDTRPLGRFCSAEFSFIDPDWFKEMMLELENKRPEFAIVSMDFSKFEPYRPTLGKYLDEVNEYLNKNYKVAASYSSVNILRRK